MSRQRLIEDKIIKTGKVNWRRFKFLQKESFKEITKKQMDKLKASILNNDFIETFKCWEANQNIQSMGVSKGDILCLDGYHRCLALSELAAEGYQVPEEFTANFVWCKNEKDAAKKVLVYSSIYASVTDEGLYEFSHDFNLNFDEIKFEIDIPKLDLDRYEAGYVRDEGYNEEEDNVPEPPAEPTAKVGDLYLLGGRHRLLCGDSTKADDVARLMDGMRVDMVFTDPPYGMNLDCDFSKMPRGGNTYSNVIGDDKEFDPSCIFFVDAAEYYIWGADWFYERMPAGYSPIVWDKQPQYCEAGPQNHFEICWTFPKKKRRIIRHLWSGYTAKEKDEKRVHPTQKPISVIVDLIEHSSAKTVLDLFGGSGSTLIACEQTNRTCYMMEIEPMYIDVIIERYKNLTGKDVELIESINRAANE